MKNLNLRPLFLVLGFILCSSLAHAGYFLGGGEIEFTNEAVTSDGGAEQVNSYENVKAQRQMVAQIAKVCDRCRIKKIKNRYDVTAYKITFPDLDNWWAIIDVDPGVIEVQIKPSTTAEFRKHKDGVQKYIFDAAAAVNLLPRWDLGCAGQLHVGIDAAFADDPKLFYNYMLSIMNEFELFWGVFEFDVGNAPTFNMLPIENQIALDMYLKTVKERYRQTKKFPSIQEISEYFVQHIFNAHPLGWAPAEDFQVLSLKRVVNPNVPKGQKTIEIRGLRAPRTADEFLMYMEIFEARLEKTKAELRKYPELPNRMRMYPFNMPDEKNMEVWYRQFLKGLGLNWDRYKVLMPAFAGETEMGDPVDFYSSEFSRGYKAMLKTYKLEQLPKLYLLKKSGNSQPLDDLVQSYQAFKDNALGDFLLGAISSRRHPPEIIARAYADMEIAMKRIFIDNFILFADKMYASDPAEFRHWVDKSFSPRTPRSVSRPKFASHIDMAEALTCHDLFAPVVIEGHILSE